LRPPPAFYHHIPEEKRHYYPFTFTSQFNPSEPTDITMNKAPRPLLPKGSPGKCSGPPSCESCVVSGRACVFEPYKDRRRKEALRHAERAAEGGAKQDVYNLVKRMKQSSSVDDSLAELQEMAH
ncbi:hypothetical protein ASPBRDRAFT_112742, partial [Aspergillus brasiliensis CBS 101740]